MQIKMLFRCLLTNVIILYNNWGNTKFFFINIEILEILQPISSSINYIQLNEIAKK